MDDFIPEKKYQPEDEYEALEITPPSEASADAADSSPKEPQTGASAPAQSAPNAPGMNGTAAVPQPVNPQQGMRQPVYPQQPVQPIYPQQQAQPVYPQQQAQPVYPRQPMRQPVYPQPPVRCGAPGYPQQAQPVYPQPMQQQAQNVFPQQSMQKPVNQQVYPQAQPVYPQQPMQQQASVQTQVQTPVQAPVQASPQPPVQAPVQNAMPLSPNPYAQDYGRQPAPTQPHPNQPKPATPTGTKVFIIILCALLAAMVIGFIVYVASTAKDKDKSQNDNPFGNYSIDNGGEDDNGFGISPFINNNSVGSYTEVEDEITLKADNGDTQKRGDDNEASVGTPDESAKNITLSELPKDKDDAKYTTQSAYESVSDSVVTVVCYEGEITDEDNDAVSSGSGTIISTDGYLITNAHVIGNSRVYAVKIVLNNGDHYQAKIVGYDTWTDLAVLKIDAKDLKAVTFGDSSLINVGDDVIAIGSPGGEKFQNSLTKGIVSAVDRELSVNKYVRYIQSDAAISPGSSGGPLCNIYGQVIGITTAKTVAEYYENMSFSIPSATVEEIVGDLMHYGYVKGRTRIGITGSEVGSDEIYYYSMPAGVEISEIDESGSVAGSDIKEGDIITELDGKEITSFQDIYDVLAKHQEGDKITIKVQRPENR
ncbi:MAG: trypsin-like peptidase domain-containing protein [Ruminococcus sp.]|nr:trypsin-like peptidase domain-containing protein [Ruminococcus sp.]